MSIIRFQGAIVPADIDRLSIVGGKSPVPPRLLQASAHRGLLAATGGCSRRALRALVLAVLVRVLLRIIGCARCCCPCGTGCAASGTC
jgi:hypothetical protein